MIKHSCSFIIVVFINFSPIFFAYSETEKVLRKFSKTWASCIVCKKHIGIRMVTSHKCLYKPYWECLLIHEADPQSRPVVINIFTRVVRLSVRTSIPTSKSRKTKQLSSENNDRYRRDCGSGRVDHGIWHTFLVYLLAVLMIPQSALRNRARPLRKWLCLTNRFEYSLKETFSNMGTK